MIAELLAYAQCCCDAGLVQVDECIGWMSAVCTEGSLCAVATDATRSQLSKLHACSHTTAAIRGQHHQSATTSPAQLSPNLNVQCSSQIPQHSSTVDCNHFTATLFVELKYLCLISALRASTQFAPHCCAHRLTRSRFLQCVDLKRVWCDDCEVAATGDTLLAVSIGK